MTVVPRVMRAEGVFAHLDSAGRHTDISFRAGLVPVSMIFEADLV